MDPPKGNGLRQPCLTSVCKKYSEKICGCRTTPLAPSAGGVPVSTLGSRFGFLVRSVRRLSASRPTSVPSSLLLPPRRHPLFPRKPRTGELFRIGSTAAGVRRCPSMGHSLPFIPGKAGEGVIGAGNGGQMPTLDATRQGCRFKSSKQQLSAPATRGYRPPSLIAPSLLVLLVLAPPALVSRAGSP
jgi:hypothetical protein